MNSEKAKLYLRKVWQYQILSIILLLIIYSTTGIFQLLVLAAQLVCFIQICVYAYKGLKELKP